MSFHQVLEKYRSIAFSEKDKGHRFERLMQGYLRTEPLYADQFSDVWLWSEFPHKQDFRVSDTGIDLVAKTTILLAKFQSIGVRPGLSLRSAEHDVDSP